MPAEPKIYHIIHVDRLPSVVNSGCLWCDAEIAGRSSRGTIIGMNKIKQRRLNELRLRSHWDLHVGDCVPFYFCPRSVMLYIIHQANNSDLGYRGGQGPIIHLEADLQQTVAWAKAKGLRWAFTKENAGSYYFDDWCDLAQLGKIDWDAVQAREWRHCKEGKQAEFLVEHHFTWELVSRIGVQSNRIYAQVATAIESTQHKPLIEIRSEWYY